jgi:sulfatase maturation enzyme AslB (radical SAM superfamily)
MTKQVVCGTAIGYEYPPDGGKVPVIDAYDGCQLCCPYCFQWQDQTRNQDILIKTNLPEILAHELGMSHKLSMSAVGATLTWRLRDNIA